MKYTKKILSFSCALIFAVISSTVLAEKSAVAIFAGGCFWSMQHDFDKVPGVIKTVVGYTGGHLANPSYEQVSSGDTGHYEAIKITYDPSKISYEQLLNFYWHDIDPSNSNGQFCDSGEEYRSVIFYGDGNQKKLALQSKTALENAHRFQNIATQIEPANIFYPAETYHQKYAEKNPNAYSAYRYGCKRDETIRKVWGSP